MVVPISTEVMMRSFPGLAVSLLENGGMCFDPDGGDYVDAIDVTPPPLNSAGIDVNNGDGDKGRFGVVDSYEETDPEREEEELAALIAAQAEDEATTRFMKTTIPEEDGDGEDDGDSIFPESAVDEVVVKEMQSYPHRIGVRKKSRRGRNDAYKNFRNRGAGTKKDRF